MKPNYFFRIFTSMASLAFWSGMPSATGATLFWDGTSSGTGADGGTGTWSTDAGFTNWKTSTNGGNDVSWTNGSDAVLGGIGGIVTVSGTVSATSLSFGAAGYSLSGGIVALAGTPVIDVGGNDVTLGSTVSGSVPISKTGTGTLTLSVANGFSNVFNIGEGTVKVGSSGAFGSISKGTMVSAGATLDLNGQSLPEYEWINFSGTGMGGVGAIVNNSTGSIYSVLRNGILDGPATVGGTVNWGFGIFGPNSSLRMGGHTLTKVGSADFRMNNCIVSNPGNIDLQEGNLWLESSTALGGSFANVISIRNGAKLVQSSNTASQAWTASFETDTIWIIQSGSSRWTGPVSLAGVTTLNIPSGSSMIHSGVISGHGVMSKANFGTWTLEGLNTYTGGTIVNGGKVVLKAANENEGTLRGAVTVNGNSILELAVAGALGSPQGAHVSPLTINGGLVDSTSDGENSGDIINLSAGRLRSAAGVNSVTAPSFYTLRGGSVINSLASDIPSVVSGRLNLGSGGTEIPTTFHVDPGNATEDLRIEASITESSSGHGIEKTGNGLMTLTGECLFTGATEVEAGTLMLSANSSLPNSPITVKTGGRFGSSGASKNLASLVADAGSTLILPARAGDTTTLAGDLDLTGGIIGISPVLGAGSVAGTYDLATADQIIGSGTPVLDMTGAFGPTRASGSLAVSGNKIQLILSSTGANLIWNNASASGSATGTWDTTLSNFSLGGSNDVFQTFDSVTFGDSVAPGTAKTIDLGTTLAPALITVDNSNGDYTFTSSGGLAGAGSLVKTGSSSLTIGGSDSYAMSGDIIASGGTIDFSGKDISIAQLAITGGGGFSNATANVRSLDLRSGSASATLVGTGLWTKSTGDTVTLTGTNRLSGPGTVAAGALVVGDAAAPNASGALGTGSVEIAAGASVTLSRSDTVAVPNAFSGTGKLTLMGNNTASSNNYGYTLTADNREFSGPLVIAGTQLALRSGMEIGSGDVTLAGRSKLDIGNLIVPNGLHLTASGVGGVISTLTLANSHLTGEISLAGSSLSSVNCQSEFGISGSVTSNIISGPILEIGGPASLAFSSSYYGNILTLSGNSSYTGTTQINGQSILNLTGSLGATAVTVGGLGTFGGTGSIGVGGSLTFNNLAKLAVNMSGSPLTVNGDVNLGPKTTIVVGVTKNPVMDGPISVLSYTGSLTGTAAQLVMDIPSFYRKAEFGFPPGQITLDLGTKALIWKGASGTSWAVGGTKLWNTHGIGETESFYKGDSVRFDDTGSGTVNSNDYMEPSSVIFDNSAQDYTVSAHFSGPCSLIKRGSGNLKLVFSNKHTGGSFIEAGRLEAKSRALGEGPVNVAAGATLAGNATIPGPITIAGTIDPGIESYSLPATISTGPITLTGIYQCQLGTNASDKLAVTGDLDLTGSSLSLDNTFGTFTHLDFFTIATYSGTLTGEFSSVTGIPAGYALRYDTAGNRVIVTPVTLEIWAEGFPTLSDPSPGGDPDGDGIPSLVEYVLGGDPSIGDPAILQDPELDATNLLFRYKRRDSSKATTSQVVQWSSDFVHWNDIPVTESSSPNVSVISNDDLPDDITVTIPRASERTFARLKVILP